MLVISGRFHAIRDRVEKHKSFFRATSNLEFDIDREVSGADLMVGWLDG